MQTVRCRPLHRDSTLVFGARELQEVLLAVESARHVVGCGHGVDVLLQDLELEEVPHPRGPLVASPLLAALLLVLGQEPQVLHTVHLLCI